MFQLCPLISENQKQSILEPTQLLVSEGRIDPEQSVAGTKT